MAAAICNVQMTCSIQAVPSLGKEALWSRVQRRLRCCGQQVRSGRVVKRGLQAHVENEII